MYQRYWNLSKLPDNEIDNVVCDIVINNGDKLFLSLINSFIVRFFQVSYRSIILQARRQQFKR